MQGCSSSCFCWSAPCGWGWSRGLVLASWGEDWFVSTAGWSWVLFLLWAGPCQGLCLVTSCGLSKTLGSLPADGWTVFPPHWLFGLKCSSTGAYRLLGGPGLGGVVASELMPISTLQNYCYQCLCPCSESQPPAAGSVETLQYKQVGLTQGLMGVTAFLLGSQILCALIWPCMCPPREEFLFSPVLWKSCDQASCLPSQMFWGTSSNARPGLGAWCKTQNCHSCGENLWNIIIFLFVGCPPGVYRILILSQFHLCRSWNLLWKNLCLMGFLFSGSYTTCLTSFLPVLTSYPVSHYDKGLSDKHWLLLMCEW